MSTSMFLVFQGIYIRYQFEYKSEDAKYSRKVTRSKCTIIFLR